MNTQHGFQRIGFSAATGLGVERLDQAQQTRPGHDLIHLGEEAFAACLLALAGVFEIGKAHLAHRRLGSGGQAYFSTFENLFGDSLGEIRFQYSGQNVYFASEEKAKKAEIHERMFDRYDSGELSVQEVSQEYGCSLQWAYHIIRTVRTRRREERSEQYERDQERWEREN
ncbi:hypothetical protein GHO34_27240 [Pseudomonas sp. FSL R10-2245]|nr:hypothetical protein [Pseudomonas sp. FSL R10-2245]